MARTPARVFACVLAQDSGRLTAAELAERLGVSAAAISGAVRYLTQTGMLVRGREPGERRDHYAVHGDVWTEMYASRLGMQISGMAGFPIGAGLRKLHHFAAW